MNRVHEAFLKAAKSIEDHPELFRVSSTQMPTDCKTPGCALGWVGVSLGITTDWWTHPEFYDLLGLTPVIDALGQDGDEMFYERMETLACESGVGFWDSNAKQMAVLLRSYAAKYHPAEAQP